MITAGCGGSNGDRNRLWKWGLQTLANEISKDIQVNHYPPGTSKWNKIEHRLFAFITKNWQGIPRVSAAVMVNLISNTKIEKAFLFDVFLMKRYTKREWRYPTNN